MKELAEFLLTHDRYAVLGHVSPDGDTAGSCIALAEALERLGKEAFVYLPEPLPPRYAAFELPVRLIVGEAELPFEPETAFSVDVSDLKRLGSGCDIFERCRATAMLDHHPTNPGFGDVRYVDGAAAATGEIAVELIRLMGVGLTKTMGTWLYIAISTDCGQFGFPSTRSETMEAAAECLRAGIDVGEISRRVFRTRGEARTRVLGAIISGMERTRGGEICFSRLTEEMLRRYDAGRADSDGAVNYLLEVEGVRIAILAEERENGVKFSLRSNPPVDVARNIAFPLGGGGHCNAAGVFLEMPLEAGLEKVLALAERTLDEQSVDA